MSLKILIPTDFSDPSQQAIAFSARLAEDIKGVEFTFLHCISFNDISLVVLDKIKDSLAAEMQQELDKVVADFRKRTGGKVKISAEVRFGFPSPEINKFANDGKFDLIVMGTKGASGLTKFFVGSNTTRVMRDAPCPVIAVPDEYLPTKIKHIVFSTDLVNINNELQTVVLLARLLKANIHVLHVFPESFDGTSFLSTHILDDVKKQVDYENITFDAVEDKSIASGITDYVETHLTHLLVMFTGKEKANPFTSGSSLAEDLAQLAEIPVLAIPAGKRAEEADLKSRLQD